MNNISWFLYIADVVDRVGGFAFAVLISGVLVMLVAIIFGPIIVMLADEIGIKPSDLKPYVRWPATAWIIALLIYLPIPSKNTLYAIAASEVGEKIAASEQVKGIADDATKALRQWIKRQIDEPKKDAQ